MLSLTKNTDEQSALLSNARLTISTLIQRPNTITTSNAFDEFSVLDQLIDVSKDFDRCESEENRKFVNIAQLITASTCIYSRRVDALYKLINTFQTKSDDQIEENLSDESIAKQEENSFNEKSNEKKKKLKTKKHRSFICDDINKINLNSTKQFFLDRTSLLDLKLFQKFISIENKQFWFNDYQPMIFDLIFNNTDNQIFDVDKSNELLSHVDVQQYDIPLPINDNDELIENESKMIIKEKVFNQRKTSNKTRIRTVQHDTDFNIFRRGLTVEQQALFEFYKMKSITNNRTKFHEIKFFNKKIQQEQFDEFIHDCPPVAVSLFICPTISFHRHTIRERYSMQTSRTVRSPALPISWVLDDENAFVPLSTSSPLHSSSFINESNDNIQEDVDTRLRTDMEQILDLAIHHSNEEQEQNKVYVELRSSIMSYMTKNKLIKTTNVDDLVESLHENYSLPLIFSQLLHLCASTQRYCLRSTSNDNLFIEKLQ